MKTAALAKVYEMQTGVPLCDALRDIHNSLPHDEISDSEWSGKIEEALAEIDLNDPDVRRDISKTVQSSEKKKHTKAAPGEGRQLEIESLTVEWAENTGISFDGNLYIKMIDAKKQHIFAYWKQRQANAADATDAAVRAGELLELSNEDGGLAGALRRRGVKGW